MKGVKSNLTLVFLIPYFLITSVQFVTLLKRMFSEAVGLLEQVGFKPSPKLSSTSPG